MTVCKKLILMLGLIIILTVIIGTVALLTINEITNTYFLADRQRLITEYSEQIEIAILECRRAEKNFWLRRDKQYVDQIKKHLERLKQQVIQINKQHPDKGLDEQLTEINVLAKEYYAQFLKSVSCLEAGQQVEQVLLEDTPFVIVARQLQSLSEQIARQAKANVAGEIEKTKQIRKKAVGIVVVVLIIVVTASSLIAFFISRGIIRSITTLMQTMKDVETGRLTSRADVHSKDELHRLGDCFNQMLDRLEEDKRREDALYQQISHAEKLASLGRLSAGIAHEINNPLTSILTSGHLLLKKTHQDAAEREDLEIIVNETLRCRKIIKDLLDFARQPGISIQPSNINLIIERTLTLMKNITLSRNIKIHKELCPSLPSILIDPYQIQQVFTNIILNAQEAISDNGTIAVSSHIQDGFIQVRVTDTGCGIPEENMSRLFEPFFTTKDEGTGLGLAVSYGIIERHQGRLEVFSQAGKGTTVIVKLSL